MMLQPDNCCNFL